MPNVPTIFNSLEALLWLLIAIELLRRGLAATARMRIQLFVAAAAFAFFGGSDIVEIWSGGWWRPWWLLIWKAACVLTLAAIYLDHLRHRPSRRSDSAWL